MSLPRPAGQSGSQAGGGGSSPEAGARLGGMAVGMCLRLPGQLCSCQGQQLLHCCAAVLQLSKQLVLGSLIVCCYMKDAAAAAFYCCGGCERVRVLVASINQVAGGGGGAVGGQRGGAVLQILFQGTNSWGTQGVSQQREATQRGPMLMHSWVCQSPRVWVRRSAPSQAQTPSRVRGWGRRTPFSPHPRHTSTAAACGQPACPPHPC